MAMQSRDSMSLTDRESSSDESDCSLETVQSFAPGTPRKRKRNAKCGGEKPAAKQSREEGEKGGRDSPNDTETAKRDNEVVTSGKQTAARSEQTPAEGPSTRKGEVAMPQPMGKAMRQGIGQPVLCDHPVIIEDLMRPGPAGLRSLDWKMGDILKNEVGTVRSIRPISESKTIVGCDSSQQQSRLVKRLKIGQVEVKCTIPEPTVQMEVRGISRNVQMDGFMKRIEWVSDNGGHTHSKVKVKGASRLTFKDGTASRAISHVRRTEDENQQAGIQRQAVRGRGTTLLQVPQIRAHKAAMQSQAGGLPNVWPPRPLFLLVQSKSAKVPQLWG